MSTTKRALKNKVLRKTTEPSFPTLIAVRYFIVWDKSKFADDNFISSVPNKNEVRKEIKESLVNLSLQIMLLDGDFGSNPTIEEVTPFYKKISSHIGRMLAKDRSLEDRDYDLCRAYIRALKDLSKRSSKLLSFLRKNEQYLKEPIKKKKAKLSKNRKKIKKKSKKVRGIQEQYDDRIIKSKIQEMLKNGDIRRLGVSSRNTSLFVSGYLDSASLNPSRARTEKTKKNAEKNKRKLRQLLKNK